MSALLNSSTPESGYSSSSSVSPPSSDSSCSIPFEEARPAGNLPYRNIEPVKPQSKFLFIDFQADKSENKKLRNEKQGFLLQNYHRRKKQASIQRLKTPLTASANRLLIKSSTSEQSPAENAEYTREQDEWLDEIEFSRRTPGQAEFRSDIWSLNAYLGQGFVDPFEVSAMKMTSSMNMYFHHCTHIVRIPGIKNRQKANLK